MILVSLAAAWCVGVVAASQLSAPPFLLLLGGTAFGVGSLLARRGSEGWTALVLAPVAALAVLAYDGRQPTMGTNAIARLNDGGEVHLRGMIAAEPERRERSQLLRVKVDAYLEEGENWTPAGGTVLVTTRLFPAFAYGDFVELRGKLQTPERLGSFDYRAYLARQGIESVSVFPALHRTGSGGGSDIRRGINAVRNRLAAGIEASMPEPEASLATGILLGKRSSIPEDVNDDFRASGLSHLIAISGGNIALVAGFVIALFWPLVGRRPAILGAIAVVTFYAVLVGGSPSVLRATPMALAGFGAELAGRPGRGLHGLVLVVGLLLLWDPLLVDDVSFQLSAVATGGLILGVRPVSAILGRVLGAWLPGGAAGLLAEQLAMTIAASIAVLPILAASFGSVSLVSVGANVVAAPAFVLVLAGAFVSAVAGVIDPGLGRIVGEAAALPVTYLIGVAHLFGTLPFAVVAVPGLAAWLFAAGLALPVWLLLRRQPATIETEQRPRVSGAIAAALVLAVIGAVLWVRVLIPEGRHLEVTVLDVGQGDAILVELPDGRTILVDGGPSVSRLLNGLGDALPSSKRRLDLVVLTHGQEDHVAGLAGLFGRYTIGAVLMVPEDGGGAAYRVWREGLADHGVPVYEAEAGLVAGLGDGLVLEVLWPQHPHPAEVNERSVVLRLTYGNVSVLLTGDIGAEAEAALLDAGLPLQSTVLKVAHHGSDGSSDPRFLEAVSPALAAISAGRGNIYGHPSPTTRLRLANIPLYRTDMNGSIRLRTDGVRLWVEHQRGRPEIVNLLRAEK